MKSKVTLFWFRRDLRLEDNVGLQQALQSGFPVLPLFIFDTDILHQLEDKKDRRVDYIHQALSLMNDALKAHGSAISFFHDSPSVVFEALCEQYDVQAVYCNRDYEPTAIQRDTLAFNFFKTKEIPFKAFKDQVIFDKSSIVKADGKPYTVYTPYARRWKENLQPSDLKAAEPDFTQLLPLSFVEIPTLESLGFEKTAIRFSKPTLDLGKIADYDKHRDFPAMEKTTELGIALRFGTISVRKCVTFAQQHNQTWLSELIWREFFMQILYHFPQVVQQSFKVKYDAIVWRNDEADFQRWCDGNTGYPIVDAGMRQLNTTGFMHNRVRMIVASFLCKHLLIDWRWGEAYFAAKLDDYDLSANNGNWQWAAGSGCDAAPYFRVFNPTLQTVKFDKDLAYVRKWVPELDTFDYPQPMVEHAYARERALATYGRALKAE
ncbi:cryptochrome/photolyase family protein [Sphingobacterium sp. MYb382]|uniref:cryptochrome/photolyase family protein n=1 Tax=Sphingobacterium sp. MYb382 TaxID=2745278 RepID=UPI0030A2EE6A